MTRVTVSEAARRDLDDIYDYGVTHFGAEAAETYLRQIDHSLDRIGAHPLIGMLNDRIRPPIRSLRSGSHRVYYDVLEDRCVVRRVLHVAMDIERWL